MIKYILPAFVLLNTCFALTVDDLVKEYPEFNNLRVKIVSTDGIGRNGFEFWGYHLRQSNQPDLIAISTKIEGEQLRHTFLHEMAHAVFNQFASQDEQMQYCRVARVNLRTTQGLIA